MSEKQAQEAQVIDWSNDEVQQAAERVVAQWPKDGDPSVGQLREMLWPGKSLLFTSIGMREQRKQLLAHPFAVAVMAAASKLPAHRPAQPQEASAQDELDQERMCLICGFIPVEGMKEFLRIHGEDAQCVVCQAPLPSGLGVVAPNATTVEASAQGVELTGMALDQAVVRVKWPNFHIHADYTDESAWSELWSETSEDGLGGAGERIETGATHDECFADAALKVIEAEYRFNTDSPTWTVEQRKVLDSAKRDYLQRARRKADWDARLSLPSPEGATVKGEEVHPFFWCNSSRNLCECSKPKDDPIHVGEAQTLREELAKDDDRLFDAAKQAAQRDVWFREALRLLWLYRDGFRPTDVATTFLQKTLDNPNLRDIREVNPLAQPPAHLASGERDAFEAWWTTIPCEIEGAPAGFVEIIKEALEQAAWEGWQARSLYRTSGGQEVSGEYLHPHAPVGSMKKVSEVIAYFQDVLARYGDSCVYIRPEGCCWGAEALNRESEDRKLGAPGSDLERVTREYERLAAAHRCQSEAVVERLHRVLTLSEQVRKLEAELDPARPSADTGELEKALTLLQCTRSPGDVDGTFRYRNDRAETAEARIGPLQARVAEAERLLMQLYNSREMALYIDPDSKFGTEVRAFIGPENCTSAHTKK